MLGRNAAVDALKVIGQRDATGAVAGRCGVVLLETRQDRRKQVIGHDGFQDE
jgi:hypothetical protein